MVLTQSKKYKIMWKEIEKIMKKQGISIYRLAKLTKLPDTTIRNYKKGTQLSFINACKIADALGVSLDQLRGSGDRDESDR